MSFIDNFFSELFELFYANGESRILRGISKDFFSGKSYENSSSIYKTWPGIFHCWQINMRGKTFLSRINSIFASLRPSTFPDTFSLTETQLPSFEINASALARLLKFL